MASYAPSTTLKYHAISDAAAELGSVEAIGGTLIGCQPKLFGGAPQCLSR